MAGAHDGVIHVGRCRADDGVLTTGLCRQRSSWLSAQDQLCGVGASGEDDMLDLGSLCELVESVALSDDDLQSLFRHTGIPEGFGKEPGYRSSDRGGLQDDRVAGSQPGHGTATRNGAREVPR